METRPTCVCVCVPNLIYAERVYPCKTYKSKREEPKAGQLPCCFDNTCRNWNWNWNWLANNCPKFRPARSPTLSLSRSLPLSVWHKNKVCYGKLIQLGARLFIESIEESRTN